MAYVHGGGWRFGEPAMMRGYCILMARHGYPCMASEYRFTGEAPWPAQIDDVQAAISWLRENGAQCGVNPGQIVLWGGSAGGHLILQAAAEISNAQGKSSPIAARAA